MNDVHLAYVHDPMCSWCYGFRDSHQAIVEAVHNVLPVRRLLGGLAPDTDEPMPTAMQEKLQQIWQRIEKEIPGTKFNFDFWALCEPRRATYAACRAVIAAKAQGEQFDYAMTDAIQRAYYEQARNPSDHSVLVTLAEEIGLDELRFGADLTAESTHQALLEEIKAARSIGVNSYPSMAVVSPSQLSRIELSYTQPQRMIDQIMLAVGKMNAL